MLNFIKKKISAEEITKKCIFTFALIIHSVEDKSFKESWLRANHESQIHTLLEDGLLNIFIRDEFQSDSFTSKYKKLNEFEIQLVKKGIFRASISMKEYINDLVGIWEARAYIRNTTPGMHVSFKYPSYGEYASNFFSVKMIFINYFPD